jgi:signal transduction histidine kinase
VKLRPFGPAGWGAAFVLVALLVVGGLGWVTVASLRVEAAQLEATARADRANQERLALWRLDGHLLPALGLENNRPFGHYSALYTQYPVWDVEQDVPAPGMLQVASPLLSADLPPWMLLHFQLDPDRGWESPQVIPPELAERLHTNFLLTLACVTPERAQALADLRTQFPAGEVLSALAERDRDRDDDPFVVPVPVADETAVPKSPGGPGGPEPAQPRPYGPVPGPTGVTSADAHSRFAQERLSGPPAALGMGRANSVSGGFGPAADRGGFVPAADRGGFGPAADRGGFAESPLPDVLPGVPPRPAPQAAFPGVTHREHGSAQAPGNKAEPQKPAAGDYDARKQATELSMKHRGGLENSQQLGRTGQNPITLSTVPEKPSEPPAPGSPPAPGGPLAPGGPSAPGGSPALAAGAAPAKDRAVQGEAIVRGAAGPDPKAKKEAEKDAKPDLQWWPFWGNRPAAPPGGQAAPTAGAGGSIAPVDRLAVPSRDEARQRGSDRFDGAEAADPPETGRVLAVDVFAAGTRKSAPTVQPVAVQVGPIRPVWLTAVDGSEALVLVRAARLEGKTVFQGVLLDWLQLQAALREQVADLFPAATLAPIRQSDPPNPERAMTALPVQLDPGPAPEPPPAGWSALRLGLVMAWAAALIGLAAVGVGGRALVDLSERRIRFVSAVTHELRTPLTSLRLYLDLLNSGMIEDEQKQREYLGTLATESERLHRLIENVLDFARLEKRTVEAHRQPTNVTGLLDEVRQTWAERCAADGKELVVISTLPPEYQVTTDPRMVAQVIGNLVDNARKYTRDAADGRIWVWAKPGERDTLVLEVEDRGHGVPACERGSIFRPFQRGKDADTTAGGAGLGLALAKHWADLLGGTLSYKVADGGVGACFRLELPARG